MPVTVTSPVISRLPRRLRGQYAPKGQLTSANMQAALCALRHDRLACRQLMVGLAMPHTSQYRLAMIRQTRIAIR